MGLKGWWRSLFKSPSQRELERDISIQNVVDLYKRRVVELEKHERAYTEKAIRAKRSGDAVNYEKLLRMLAQTIRERRRTQSAQLSFEALVQTRDRVKGYEAFARGLSAATRSIASVFRGIDLSEALGSVQSATAQARQLDRQMEIVMDRLSGGLAVGEGVDEEGLRLDDLDRVISEKASHEETKLDLQIDETLKEVEDSIKRSSSK